LGWHFVQNGTSGIVALESIIVSDTLAIFFDNFTADPLQINDHPALGALWNLETNTASPLNVLSDTFCGSGAILSNGTMVTSIVYPRYYIIDSGRHSRSVSVETQLISLVLMTGG